jgi:hypothetical protein
MALTGADRVCAAAPAERVEIKSGWNGLSPDGPEQTRILLERRGNAYLMTGTTGHARQPQPLPPTSIDVARVAALVDAMEQPRQDGVSLAWATSLQGQARKVLDRGDNWVRREYRLPQQREMIDAVAGDPQRLRDALTKGYGGSLHTDDYPDVAIRITLADGAVVTAHSASQHTLMLPWNRAPGGTTFSADISHALAALLPSGSTNRDRFADAMSDLELEEILTGGMRSDLDRIAADAGAAGALHQLQARFRVDEVRFRTTDNILFATLHQPGEAFDFAVRLSLPLKNGALVDPDREFRRVDSEIASVRLSTAMMLELKRLPQDKRVVRISSLGGDFQEIRRESVATSLAAHHQWPDVVANPDLLTNAVEVETEMDDSVWIVLADGRATRYL